MDWGFVSISAPTPTPTPACSPAQWNRRRREGRSLLDGPDLYGTKEVEMVQLSQRGSRDRAQRESQRLALAVGEYQGGVKTKALARTR